MKTRTLLTAGLAALLLAPVSAYAGPAGGPDEVRAKALTATLQYSDELTYTITWTVQDGGHVSLAASGLPADFAFTDHGDNTATIEGTDTSPPGDYPFTVTATEDDSTQHEEDATLTVTKEDARVRMLRTNPDSVSRRKSFVVKARVQDADDGSLGDITKAEPGVFVVEDTRGHLATCPATIVRGSLDTGRGPDSYQVRCRVAAGLHRGNYRVTYAVAGDYYAGRKSYQVQITR